MFKTLRERRRKHPRPFFATDKHSGTPEPRPLPLPRRKQGDSNPRHSSQSEFRLAYTSALSLSLILGPRRIATLPWRIGGRKNLSYYPTKFHDESHSVRCSFNENLGDGRSRLVYGKLEKEIAGLQADLFRIFFLVFLSIIYPVLGYSKLEFVGIYASLLQFLGHSSSS